MLSLKPLISRLFLASAFVACPVFADTFVEEDGILIMEAESSPAEGDWSLQSSIGGYAGSGYLVWAGPDAFGQSSAGRGTITYRFRIKKAGNYELQWRSRITKGNNQTEHNDSWIRFPTSTNIPGEQPLNGWTKVFMSTLNKWAWQSATVDHVGRRVRQHFSAGEHTIQISGRSNGHAIDRISLFHYADVSFPALKFDALGQSGTTDSEPPPAPAPEEAGLPAEESAEDSTAQDPPVEDFPSEDPAQSGDDTAVDDLLQLSGQVYSSSAIELFWSNDASVISTFEIRRNDQLLTISDGASYFEDGLVAGTPYRYSVTAIDSSGAVMANESVSLTTLDGFGNGGGIDELSLTALSYSQSAVEIFWSADWLDAKPETLYEIYLNDEFIQESDGRSYFVDTLTAGADYEFRVTAVDLSGNRTDSNRVSVSTYPPDSQ